MSDYFLDYCAVNTIQSDVSAYSEVIALSSEIKIEGKGKHRLSGPLRNVKLSNMGLNEKTSVKILVVVTLCHFYSL